MKPFKKIEKNRGMTYVELIVVLGIFSVLSSIVIFNYGEFQSKIDMKNLANDIALKIVEAQKAAIFGKFPNLAQQVGLPSTWKPSYGIYLNKTSDAKSFFYFVDLNGNHLYDGGDCTGECVEKITITKDNSISSLDVFYLGDTTAYSVNDLTLSFVRPNSIAEIKSATPLNSNISYVQITVISPKAIQTNVKLYTSGRIQIN